MTQRPGYVPRTIDRELDLLIDGLPAIAVEGLKGVGKTVTAARRARTIHRLDDPDQLAIISADPGRLTQGPPPILIDEWQRLPESWDRVRRAVDDDPGAGRFLLTASALARPGRTHSGAGRIVTLRMRPLTLSERGRARPTVRLSELLAGGRPPITGATSIGLTEYVDEILASGLPGVRGASDRIVRARLDGFLDRMVEADIPDAGRPVRDPAQLRRWLRAYAAAISTTATFETIRAAATAGRGDAPARTTVQAYIDTLARVWLIEPVPGWLPRGSHLRRLTIAEKHQFVDPALAARLLGVTRTTLLDGAQVEPVVPRDGPYLGALFESLVCLEVRVGAQLAEAKVFHLRTKGGEREVDLIVERADGAVVAIEVKLARTIDDADVRHLRWLGEQLGDRLLDSVVVSTGGAAYRRPDGIAVVPAALLGP
jgi:predicted AAA+ superfamily ATPase